MRLRARPTASGGCIVSASAPPNHFLYQFADTDGSAQFTKAVTVGRGVTEVELLGTFPNPARGPATVRYALPEKRDVTIRLYDVLGRQVQMVAHAEQEGRREQMLDTSGLSSGVYFLGLRAEGRTRTRRLTVLR